MGCGDLSNPLTTAIGVNLNQFLHIHINDINLLIIARNILILKIISSTGFNPDNKFDLDYIWNLWYNATWPKTILKRFIEDVKDLLSQPLPHNIFIPESSIYLERLKAVWSEWLSTVENISVENLLADRYRKLIQLICYSLFLTFTISLKCFK